MIIMKERIQRKIGRRRREIAEDFGRRLRAARQAAGLTQAQAAVRVGTWRHTWATWERAEALPNQATREVVLEEMERRK